MRSVVVSAVVSLLVAAIVSYLSPWFTHFVWKKQKLREQQLAVAEKFARVSTNVYARMLADASGQGFANWKDAQEAMAEQQALLFLMPILFEKEEIKIKSLRLSEILDHGLSSLTIRMELQAYLFAEALDIKVDTILAQSERAKERAQ